MNDHSINIREENKDKLKSGIITAIIWSLLLLFIFVYKFTENIPEKKEVVTQMLINFGDNRNGNGVEEPANQEGSLAAKANSSVEDQPAEPESKTKIIEKPAVVSPAKKETPKEKIITGTDAKNAVKTADKSDKNAKTSTASTSSKPAAKTSSSKTTSANSATGNGDGKGSAAIGNLIKGRGTKPGSQGDGTGIGNQGDPLGGDGNGDSKIGIDRKLIGYIPGTMGRGGAQPSHNCPASGSITISYTVDKAGNVVSARRSGGISDACVVSTSVSWVKQYVKAEKSNTSSTGVYSITF
ncbi:ferric siderophore ABC transporter substrate-binding protein [Chryseobacterium gotjawalense]|uniref:Ferric siderophore ABC transporter substrate-binding protein n=1 Tax=Chryseobacterium gotjawalense TaxID=3042315 RepID=A0ABY8RAI7_9FLAO|nr:ferric siderophore ABC transporter substrate-binding protein [Chryseobacterium sp. wdc7]WHF50836.1 ferric siderophore ABC transporter substrate-binding protein [Chryseobacterium sp. wdc7]